MLYLTSDLHFNHKNVLNYCNRPFQSVEEMNSKLIEIWNNTVKDEDIVYVLGDFSLNPKWSAEIVPKLKGTKYLIMGNHDAPYPEVYGRPNKKAELMKERYLNDGWKEVLLYKEIILKNNITVALSHLPYGTKEGNEYDTRCMSYRPEDKGLVLLHGHLHGRYKKYGRMIDVGIDAHDLQLLSEDDIIKLIEDPRDFIETSLTNFYKKRNIEKEGLKNV